MKPRTRNLLSVLIVVLGIAFYEMIRPVGQPPGILAPDPPTVGQPPEKAPVFERDGHVLTGLAPFEAHARVVSIERYGKDRMARIAPLDIVLGWGPLSDTTSFKGVDVGQTERTVLFETFDPKLPREVVAAHLMNVHAVGADAQTDKDLRELKRGNIVRIQGWLVEAVASDGWRWKGEARAAAPAMPGTVLWVQKLEAK